MCDPTQQAIAHFFASPRVLTEGDVLALPVPKPFPLPSSSSISNSSEPALPPPSPAAADRGTGAGAAPVASIAAPPFDARGRAELAVDMALDAAAGASSSSFGDGERGSHRVSELVFFRVVRLRGSLGEEEEEEEDGDGSEGGVSGSSSGGGGGRSPRHRMGGMGGRARRAMVVSKGHTTLMLVRVCIMYTYTW